MPIEMELFYAPQIEKNKYSLKLKSVDKFKDKS